MFSVTLPQDDVSCSATFQLSFHLIWIKNDSPVEDLCTQEFNLCSQKIQIPQREYQISSTVLFPYSAGAWFKSGSNTGYPNQFL
jgi:hypothetical protein